MKLKCIRIENFRSIKDCKFVDLSKDNMTVVIGQNESGKSAFIDAINSFFTGVIDDDDIRESYPLITGSFVFTPEELKVLQENENISPTVTNKLQALGRLNIIVKWNREGGLNSPQKLLEEDDLKSVFENLSVQEETNETTEQPMKTYMDEHEFISYIQPFLPKPYYFQDISSTLPSQIDLIALKEKDASVPGFQAVKYLEKIVGPGFDFVSELDGLTEKQVDNKLHAISQTITEGFQVFWSQFLAKGTTKIQLEIQLKRHAAETPGKSGQPYLKFYICDGNGRKLDVKQRSSGVKWYLSFYIYLSSLKRESEYAITLLDEPGNSLHSRAKADIYSLIEEITNTPTKQVIYCTHYPELIPFKNSHRILAAERNADSNTEIISALNLSSANIETVKPLLNSIGQDIAVPWIPGNRTVIFEEASGYYFFRAFKELLEKCPNVNFTHVNGANNMRLGFSLFTGIGIMPVGVLDNDEKGKEESDFILENYFGGKTDLLAEHLLLLPTENVESLFSANDYKKFIDKDSATSQEDLHSKKSKILTAIEFYLKVKDGQITRASLTNLTLQQFSNVLTNIETMIASL